MAENMLTPRVVLARNLTALVKKTGDTNRSVAARTGGAVDAKTVNNQMNARFDSRLEQVDAVAMAFGYRYYDLLNPQFDPNAAPDPIAKRMLEIYAKTTDAGRDSMRSVAVLAAGLTNPEPPAIPQEEPVIVPAPRRRAARR